jgi:hypothetical protein
MKLVTGDYHFKRVSTGVLAIALTYDEIGVCSFLGLFLRDSLDHETARSIPDRLLLLEAT